MILSIYHGILLFMLKIKEKPIASLRRQNQIIDTTYYNVLNHNPTENYSTEVFEALAIKGINLANIVRGAKTLVKEVALFGLDLAKVFFHQLPLYLVDVIKCFTGLTEGIATYELNKEFFKSIDQQFLLINYGSIAEYEARVPPHFSANYLSLLMILDKAVDEVLTINKDLVEFEIEIVKFLNDKTYTKKDQQSKIAVYKNKASYRLAVKNEIAALHKNHSGGIYQPYQVVVKKQSDWSEIKRVYERIIQKLNQLNGKELKKVTDRIAEGMKLLKEGIDKGKFEEPHPSFAPFVSNGSLYLAEKVEMYAIIRFQLSMLENAMFETVKAVKKRYSED